jgi:F0F1-type ATP synthase assembly protein I
MLRTILAVIAAYVTMFVLLFATFTGAFLIMGTEWSFKPGSFEASNAWVAMSLIAGLVISILAGFICAVIAKGGKAPVILAIVVFVLGMVLAIPSVIAHQRNAGRVRAGNLTQAEAMQNAVEPIWAPFTFPIIGAVGVLIGGKLRKR